jgi:hypothetical protein|tara:strand:+ start:387 stop:527 length:141 start_codon:yes stop_codon:yes gene_type:complete
MDRKKLKPIVRELKSLVKALESEVYSDVDAYNSPVINNLDDDGYTD